MGVTMTNKRMFVLAVALGFVGGFTWVALARDAGDRVDQPIAIFADAN